MSHADSLAVLNATAKKEATKEAEKKKQDAADKKKAGEEQAIKIKEAREEKKKDAARLKAEKAMKITQAFKKEAEKKKQATKEWPDWSDDDVNTHLMELSQFNEEENGEEKDGTPKTLFDGEEETNSPASKRTKRSSGALKSNQRYTKSTTAEATLPLYNSTLGSLTLA